MTSSGFAILGRAALLPGPATRFDADPDLKADLHGERQATLVRTLSGQLSRKPDGMNRWSRLDRYGRALAEVSTRAVARNRDLELATGVVVSSQRSCHETNAVFDRGLIDKGPRLASPLLFPYTLPGAAVAEVAMLLQFGGPYLVFPGGPAAALASLVVATDLLTASHAPRALVVSADVLGQHTLRDLGSARTPSELQFAEAAAAMWLGRADDPAPGPRRQVSAAFGPQTSDGAEVERLMRRVVDDARLRPEDLVELIIASATGSLCVTEAATSLAPSTPILQLAYRIGDAGAVLGLLAVQVALDDEGPRLIYAAEPAAAVAMVVQ